MSAEAASQRSRIDSTTIRSGREGKAPGRADWSAGQFRLSVAGTNPTGFDGVHSASLVDGIAAMKVNEATIAELTPLLEALCEDRLTPAEASRLEQHVLQSAEARWYYIAYLDLHGSLYWDAAGVGSAEALSSEEIPRFTMDVATPVEPA